MIRHAVHEEALAGSLKRLESLLQDLRKADFFLFQLEVPALRPAELQHVAGHRVHLLSRGEYHFYFLFGLFRNVSELHKQQLRVDGYRGKRAPYVVDHIVDIHLAELIQLLFAGHIESYAEKMIYLAPGVLDGVYRKEDRHFAAALGQVYYLPPPVSSLWVEYVLPHLFIECGGRMSRLQHPGVLAQHLVPIVPVGVEKGLVNIYYGAVAVGYGYGVVRELEYAPELLVQDGGHGRLPAGEVQHVGIQAAVAVTKGIYRKVELVDRAIFAQKPCLFWHACVLGVGRAQQGAELVFRALWGKGGELFPDYLFRAKAEHLFKAVREPYYLPQRVEAEGAFFCHFAALSSCPIKNKSNRPVYSGYRYAANRAP